MAALGAHGSAQARVAEPDVLALHLARSTAALRTAMEIALQHLLPEADVAILFAEEDDARTVELARGSWRLCVGERVPAAPWKPPSAEVLPLCYPGYRLGELVVSGPIEADTLGHLEHLLAHYTVALVNLKLEEAVERANDQSAASLRALHAGIGLFQERDRGAIGARFLGRFTAALGTAHGALCLLGEPDTPGARLRLDQAIGVPEATVESLRLPDGRWWPEVAVAEPAAVLVRGADGVLPRLDGTRLPAGVMSVVACPLRYGELGAGVALAFNAEVSSPSFPAELESATRLGELGAVVFHRLALEEISLRARQVETQLAIAARIQARLLPARAPAVAAAACAWSSRPAQTVGGDYLDLLADEAGQLHAVIADVSGHGVDSALLMTSMRATYRAECTRHDVAALMAKLNGEIAHEAGDTGLFVTSAVCRIDRDGKAMTYASAGHPPLLLHRASVGAILELESTGPSLGFFPNAAFDAAEVELAPGDVLLLYTDGVVETTSRRGDGEMFGGQRLRDVLRLHASAPAQRVLDAVVEALERFSGAARFEDDVSVLVIALRGPGDPPDTAISAARTG